MICEKCWDDAYDMSISTGESQTDCYMQLIKERRERCVMKLELYREYRCKMNIRGHYCDRGIEPGLTGSIRALDGKETTMYPMWLMGKDDPYPGEYAMAEHLRPGSSDKSGILSKTGLTWIASGDVKILGPAMNLSSVGPDVD